MKNSFKTIGDTTIVYCNSKEGVKECYIDTSDLPLIDTDTGTWGALAKGSKSMYAISNNNAMHRLITGAKKGEIVDHIDRDGLNNRRSNLRIVTPTESVRNRTLFKNSTSGHTGVNWSTKYQKWTAQIWLNGKSKWLGRFADMDDAIEARKKAEDEYYREDS